METKNAKELNVVDYPKIVKNLERLGVSASMISKSELSFLIKIQDSYYEKKELVEDCLERIKKNKFNYESLDKEGVISKATAHSKTKIYHRYIEMLSKDLQTLSEVDDTKYVSRETYKLVKDENKKLVSNAIDIAILEEEKNHLIEENKNLSNRVDNLLSRITKLQKELDAEKKKKLS